MAITISNLKFFLTICMLFTTTYVLYSVFQSNETLRNVVADIAAAQNQKTSDDHDNNHDGNAKLDGFIEKISPSPITDKGKTTTIAIGCAITSHGGRHLTTQNVAEKIPLLKSLVPSFCRTASSGYSYHFYASYDVRDTHFSKNTFMSAIHRTFRDIIGDTCPTKLNASLYFVKCNHNKNPAWAQNDAMMEAYLDHIDYYYRVNDDTKMLTPGWTEAYVDILQSFNPPNIGVVGPLHKGGNEDILTYDFVHRSHIDIFGSYYPRVFTDWWADNWISAVYGPVRTMKLPNVRLVHTSEVGTRYSIRNDREKFLNAQIDQGKDIIERYLKTMTKRSNSSQKIKKIISMSLWGSKTRYTYGALRNAQLLPVYFPNWKLRIYVEKEQPNGLTSFPPVDKRILTKLKNMGVEIVEVDHADTQIPPIMWRYLVADDETVNVFVVRDADCRLTDRDAIVVEDWLKNYRLPIYCVRDHPNHKRFALLGELWGGISRKMRKILQKPWKEMMRGLRSDYNQDNEFLTDVIWPAFKNSSACYDSVSCHSWPNSRPFPVKRVGTEHLGQIFDAFGNVKEDDVQILLASDIPTDCSLDYIQTTPS
ncbi:hypothetical protein HELRODRAFT_175241 [Helobdella robusta]|uniref:Uncharacterized protein n=1 Tax=Helobdella robusta TaxID=6412 RepID=T1F922_HELRO|nr:hypothetical protein HELRODRAFT_175241 [Helobdella robusta]ESO00763.1 hypothetical protein HELRODRAFT_175241 [Helobdella robusta]